jgi:hypothetical protein
MVPRQRRSPGPIKLPHHAMRIPLNERRLRIHFEHGSGAKLRMPNAIVDPDHVAFSGEQTLY